MRLHDGWIDMTLGTTLSEVKKTGLLSGIADAYENAVGFGRCGQCALHCMAGFEETSADS